jgi:hypothetical protein
MWRNLHGRSFYHEDGFSMFFRKANKFLEDCMASYPSRQ